MAFGAQKEAWRSLHAPLWKRINRIRVTAIQDGDHKDAKAPRFYVGVQATLAADLSLLLQSIVFRHLRERFDFSKR